MRLRHQPDGAAVDNLTVYTPILFLRVAPLAVATAFPQCVVSELVLKLAVRMYPVDHGLRRRALEEWDG
jgi:hypothetical protein